MQAESVSAAFTRQSGAFDAYEDHNPILQWMRGSTHTELLRFIKPGGRLLELNCGTGIDAVFFARQGLQVLATDNSEGMVKACRQKAESLHLQQQIQVQRCSYTELYKLPETRFNYVFSNFGGLNCIPDLRAVTAELPRLLHPGAYVTFVLMPKICPWELALALKGNFNIAFRRLNKNGAPSHLEGMLFTTYYFSPEQAIQSFGPGFRPVSLKGLACFSPPPYLERFPVKVPRLYKALCRLDESLAHTAPFNRWADHFILTMQYLP